ncbi:MAG: prolyl oligopeptidase family serine peptidase [Pirellulaceae bacterium]|nr:prolyl oligopeptidase family serine peptidase [Pirellulaceae bacterium]
MTFSRRELLRTTAQALACPASCAIAAEPPVTVNDELARSARDARLAMAIDPSSMSPRQLRLWQRQFRQLLGRLLGNYRPPTSWTVTVEQVSRLDDHTRHQLLLHADGYPSLPVYLLVPHRSGNQPGPGILALHGHGEFGYETVAGRDDLPGVSEAIEKSNYDYGRQLVSEGFVVCAPCMTPFGRRVDREKYGEQDPCAVTFVRMQLLGKVLMGENVRDCLWAHQLLRQHARVDADRIGCVGLSYGGRMTMLTTAMEPRIRCAVVSGALNVMRERIMGRYSCGGQVIPGLLPYGDVAEIGSLIAPRACVWETGSEDGLIVKPWADEAFARMEQFYRGLGAVDQLKRDSFEGGHRWNGTVGLPMLKHVLSA